MKHPAHGHGRFRGQTVRDWLTRLDDAGRIADHARYLAGIQRVLETALPPGLANDVSVCNVRNGTLVIAASSGAVAHRLRMMAADLLPRLANGGERLTALRVEVRPPHLPDPSPPKRATLSPAARASLDDLARSLPDSPVRAAVERFLRRQRNG